MLREGPERTRRGGSLAQEVLGDFPQLQILVEMSRADLKHHIGKVNMAVRGGNTSEARVELTSSSAFGTSISGRPSFHACCHSVSNPLTRLLKFVRKPANILAPL